MFLLTFFDCASQFRSWPIDRHSNGRSRSILSKAGYGRCVVAKLCGPVPLMVAAALILLSTLSPTIPDTDAAEGLRSMLSVRVFRRVSKEDRAWRNCFGERRSCVAEQAYGSHCHAAADPYRRARGPHRSGINIIADRE